MTNSCNCPNSSYGKKHTNECYEAEIERLKACWAEALENVTTRNREIERLRKGIQECIDTSSWETIRGDLRLVLRGATAEPEVCPGCNRKGEIHAPWCTEKSGEGWQVRTHKASCGMLQVLGATSEALCDCGAMKSSEG
jgi:hypothetical protein